MVSSQGFFELWHFCVFLVILVLIHSHYLVYHTVSSFYPAQCFYKRGLTHSTTSM